MKKTYRNLTTLILLAVLCIALMPLPAQADDTTVTISGTVNYDKGTATITWKVNGTAPSSCYVFGEVKNHGVSAQETLYLGTTSTDYIRTDKLMPGISYEITVMDEVFSTLGSATIRMPDVPEFQDGKLKSTSVKIKTEPRKYAIADQKAKSVKKLSAKEIEEGLENDVYYGVKYLMRMPQLAKGRAFFVTLVFESPDGFLHVERATDITFDRVNNGYQTIWWEIAGPDFFDRLKDTVGFIPTGTYQIYLYWDGMFVNQSSFKVGE